MNDKTGAVIVSWDFNGPGIVLVGRKKEGIDAEIINVFSGEDAQAIYNKLVPREGK